jgi:hypothetical protein
MISLSSRQRIYMSGINVPLVHLFASMLLLDILVTLKNTIMKKIFTLLVAVGFITAINAQTGSRDRDNRDTRDQQTDQRVNNNNKDFDVNDGRYNNDDRFDKTGSYNGNIKMQIAQVNRKYDFKIQKVKSDYFMRRNEKMRVIRSLEAQRQQEVRMLYARNNKKGQHDRGYDSNHHY